MTKDLLVVNKIAIIVEDPDTTPMSVRLPTKEEKTHLKGCSDQTSNSLVSAHQCHPWIGNADTHSTLKDL